MQIKPFETPLDVYQNEALNIRTPENHPKKAIISSDFFKSLAGVAGEKEVYYQAQFLPHNEYYIFHNIRLFDGKNHFQIDILILTRLFIAILEAKNYKGLVHYNEFEQIVHMKDDKKHEVYENPVSQVERHALQLQTWLYQHGYFDIPIIPLVVFSSSTKLIKLETFSKENINKIITVSNIVKTIKGFSEQYKHPVVSNDGISSLSQKILSSHVPIKRNLLTKHNMTQSDLIKGVHCPKCHHVPILKGYGKWKCPKCGNEGKDLFVDTFNHYFLLINNTISNKEARGFFGVNEDTMYRMLTGTGYKRVGTSSRTSYLLDFRKR